MEHSANLARSGRLKLFLGAAPGVGKTFAMLGDAITRQAEGADVVIGVVETHGRADTAARAAQLPAVPLRAVAHRGQTLAEMDLDAILARRPQLVLVDELAHTNAPGSRHPKRHMDVAELLAAGIDVYATLNIQHVESLNDEVAAITRIRVRETVPDTVIDAADDIVVVDLPPPDLIRRLQEGKVYTPPQAQRAMRHFFAPANLAALRELLLRRAGRRADAEAMRLRAGADAARLGGNAPGETGAPGARLLVVLADDAQAMALVRAARDLAEGLSVPWIALALEERARGAARHEALRLAERLGGAAARLPAENSVEAILDYARENGCGHLMLARAPGGLRGLAARLAQRRLLRRAGTIAVHLPAPALLLAERDGAGVTPSAAGAWPEERSAWLGSAGFVALALAVGEILRPVLSPSDTSLVFLTAVLGAGASYGLRPALLAALLGVLAENFFFLPPLYTFTVGNRENLVALVFFAIAAAIAGQLAGRLRAQVLTARAEARTTDSLYRFARKLNAAADPDDLLWAVVHQIALMLRARVVLLMEQEKRLTPVAGYPPEDVLDATDLAAATWSFQHAIPAGRGADTLPGGRWLFLPMRTARGVIGVAGIDRGEAADRLAPDAVRLLDALTDQAALAIERLRLAEELDRAHIAAEGEKLRTALLTSLSHDLRTPLASILGAASSLAAHGETLMPAARREMARTIAEEAERLNRFIGNLLDMTRLEAGRLAPDLLATDLADAVGTALARVERRLRGFRVLLDLADDLPLVRLDGVLFEQVLMNLLDNAAKYAPAGSTIRIGATREPGPPAMLRLAIADEGSGIPAEDLAHIFEKFYRARAADRQGAGTGLGLAICRGFMEAMGGTIEAANRIGGKGAEFTLMLPLAS
ncbi:MAG: sensor histidine kinase KdpD [Rhodospirillales bacterium]|nr:sensor histidine kinase KdpD [Rhodospirillales bacterium]